MSQKEINVHPVRRRAGYLSSLSKFYKTVQRIIDTEGTTEDALELQEKLDDRYTKYLESHETALAAVPKREASLMRRTSTLKNVTERLLMYCKHTLTTGLKRREACTRRVCFLRGHQRRVFTKLSQISHHHDEAVTVVSQTVIA